MMLFLVDGRTHDESMGPPVGGGMVFVILQCSIRLSYIAHVNGSSFCFFLYDQYTKKKKNPSKRSQCALNYSSDEYRHALHRCFHTIKMSTRFQAGYDFECSGYFLSRFSCSVFFFLLRFPLLLNLTCFPLFNPIQLRTGIDIAHRHICAEGYRLYEFVSSFKLKT